MISPHGHHHNSGFSFVELVVVILVLSVLAAAMLPRFMDSQVQAHEASVKAVGNAFSTAVQMVNAQWRVNGAVPNINTVPGFGDGNVSVNANGWPTGINGLNLILTGNFGRTQCSDLLNTLLLNGPSVSQEIPEFSLFIKSAHAFGGSPPRDPAADYWASAPALNRCSFEYRPISNLSISYDCLTGEVTIDDDASS
jgi:prepilin-type N-terminal cleavage/methylation domain-containing protein